jgi:hypothetical protein
MSKNIIILESKLISLIETVINENYYNPDKLYDTEYVISVLKKAPRHLKSLLNKLDDIPCKNSKGESRRCTKIPAVLHDYMWDR